MSDKPISDAVRNALRMSGWTQVEIADALGTTQASVSRFLAGKQDWPASTLDAAVVLVNGQVVVRVPFEGGASGG